jgi:hypothetical protein
MLEKFEAVEAFFETFTQQHVVSVGESNGRPSISISPLYVCTAVVHTCTITIRLQRRERITSRNDIYYNNILRSN